MGLHRAIGHTLAHKPHLSGLEFRFLRKELGLSQAALAELLGYADGQAIASSRYCPCAPRRACALA